MYMCMRDGLYLETEGPRERAMFIRNGREMASRQFNNTEGEDKERKDEITHCREREGRGSETTVGISCSNIQIMVSPLYSVL